MNHQKKPISSDDILTVIPGMSEDRNDDRVSYLPSKEETEEMIKGLTKEIIDKCAKKLEVKHRVHIGKKGRDGGNMLSHYKHVDENDNPKSSVMHTKDVNEWLKKRYSKSTRNHYLYFPSEIRKRQNMMAIFDNFDEDGNGNLELDEFLDMFEGIYLRNADEASDGDPQEGIRKHFRVYRYKHRDERLTNDQISMIREFLKEKFMRFYNFVTTKDALTKPEFIMLALDPKANDYFQEIMKELDTLIKGLKRDPEVTIPYSFEKMISYLGYSSKRDTLYNKYYEIRDEDFLKASESLENILFLKSAEIKQEHEDNEKLRKYKLKHAMSGNFKGLHLGAMGSLFNKLAASNFNVIPGLENEDQEQDGQNPLSNLAMFFGANPEESKREKSKGSKTPSLASSPKVLGSNKLSTTNLDNPAAEVRANAPMGVPGLPIGLPLGLPFGGLMGMKIEENSIKDSGNQNFVKENLDKSAKIDAPTPGIGGFGALSAAMSFNGLANSMNKLPFISEQHAPTPAAATGRSAAGFFGALSFAAALQVEALSQKNETPKADMTPVSINGNFTQHMKLNESQRNEKPLPTHSFAPTVIQEEEPEKPSKEQTTRPAPYLNIGLDDREQQLLPGATLSLGFKQNIKNKIERDLIRAKEIARVETKTIIDRAYKTQSRHYSIHSIRHKRDSINEAPPNTTGKSFNTSHNTSKEKSMLQTLNRLKTEENDTRQASKFIKNSSSRVRISKLNRNDGSRSRIQTDPNEDGIEAHLPMYSFKQLGSNDTKTKADINNSSSPALPEAKARITTLPNHYKNRFSHNKTISKNFRTNRTTMAPFKESSIRLMTTEGSDATSARTHYTSSRTLPQKPKPMKASILLAQDNELF